MKQYIFGNANYLECNINNCKVVIWKISSSKPIKCERIFIHLSYYYQIKLSIHKLCISFSIYMWRIHDNVCLQGSDWKRTNCMSQHNALSEKIAHCTVYLHLSDCWAVITQLDYLLRLWYTVEWAVYSESVWHKALYPIACTWSCLPPAGGVLNVTQLLEAASGC